MYSPEAMTMQYSTLHTVSLRTIQHQRGIIPAICYEPIIVVGYCPVEVAPTYLASGTHVTPTGFIPFDFEIMVGGPGGGSTTSIYVNGFALRGSIIFSFYQGGNYWYNFNGAIPYNNDIIITATSSKNYIIRKFHVENIQQLFHSNHNSIQPGLLDIL